MAEVPKTLQFNPEDTPMGRILKKLARSQSSIAVRSKGSQDPYTMWELNAAVASPHIIQEAVILTQRYYESTKESEEGYAKDMEVLDYISKFYLAYNALAIQDRKEAMSGFSELYAYLSSPKSREIYSYFCSSFIQSLYCYMYTTKSMGLAIHRGIGKDAVELTDAYAIMSQLSDDTRRQVYQELKAQGSLPGSDLEAILKKTLEYTDIIKGEQEYAREVHTEKMRKQRESK